MNNIFTKKGRKAIQKNKQNIWIDDQERDIIDEFGIEEYEQAKKLLMIYNAVKETRTTLYFSFIRDLLLYRRNRFY